MCIICVTLSNRLAEPFSGKERENDDDDDACLSDCYSCSTGGKKREEEVEDDVHAEKEERETGYYSSGIFSCRIECSFLLLFLSVTTCV